MYPRIPSISKETRGVVVLFVICVLLIGIKHVKLSSAMQYTDPFGCKNVLLVFARGSSQNPENRFTDNPFNVNFGSVEPESYSFFNWFKYHLDGEYPHINYKAVSIHDFPGKYDQVGYQAVRVDFPYVNNEINSEASWFPGKYRESVDHGIAETVGYLKDQIKTCPDQSIVVGGYSQGAQVMGESLFKLTPEERSKILGVGLFGDPKYIGASGDSLINPFDKSVSYPWRRGDATNKDTGMLDPRVPYVPDDLARRTISYCSRADIVCSGLTGARKHLTAAHGSYGGEPMRNSVSEIMVWSFPKLAEHEMANGGKDLSDTATFGKPDNKQRDIMFVVNDDSNLSVIQTLRYYLDTTLYPVSNKFPNTLYAAKATGEAEDWIFKVPRVENVQSFTQYSGYNPLQPMTSVSNLANTINKRYPFGQPSYGGGDYANPLGLAVEKAVFSPGWRDDSIKQVVLFTDRPVKTDYAFNLCHDSTRTRLQFPHATYNVCAENLGSDTWPVTQHPEACETIYLALTQNTCTNPIKTPGSIQMIKRTLQDEIMAAQAHKVAVDVIVPFNIRPRYNTQTEHDADIKNLQYLANATGGKFIYYDTKTQYDSISFSDTLYRVFGHTPKPLIVAYKDALNGQETFNNGRVINASTNEPIILDLSQTAQHFEAYKWDFNNDGVWDETSSSPVIQHQFTGPTRSFMHIAGVDTTNAIKSETNIALEVAEEQQPTADIQSPTAPDVTGTTMQNGDISLTWQPSQQGTVLFIDPDTKLPVAQSPSSTGSIVFTPETPYARLEVRLVTADSISDTRIVTIAPYVAPVVPDPLPIDSPPITQSEPDPTLCYKLQQCQTESAPPEAYNPQPLSPIDNKAVVQQPIRPTVSTQQTIQTGGTSTQIQPSVQGTSSEPTLLQKPASTKQVDNRSGSDIHPNLIIILVIILGGSIFLIRQRKKV